jgi:hypothetical protein
MKMKKYITERFAINSLLIIFSLVMLFHALVLMGIVPFDMVWGGRLKSKEEMIPFEITSTALNSVMLGIVATRAGLLKVNMNARVLRIAFWSMFALFFINTIGNTFSNNELEQLIFTPLTLLLSVLSLRLAIE